MVIIINSLETCHKYSFRFIPSVYASRTSVMYCKFNTYIYVLHTMFFVILQMCISVIIFSLVTLPIVGCRFYSLRRTVLEKKIEKLAFHIWIIYVMLFKITIFCQYSSCWYKHLTYMFTVHFQNRNIDYNLLITIINDNYPPSYL